MAIEKELICLNVDGQNKDEIITQLAQVAYNAGKINHLTDYKNAVFKREEEFSTALGYSVAIPHGQSDGVNEPFVVFGRCKETMIWDRNEVSMAFMIGVPMKNRDKTHMKILANISRKLLDESFRKSLLEAQDNEEVFEILSQISI
jgi:PTS system fructose-specific IIA component